MTPNFTSYLYAGADRRNACSINGQPMAGRWAVDAGRSITGKSFANLSKSNLDLAKGRRNASSINECIYGYPKIAK
jgi:hypothetical protein